MKIPCENSLVTRVLTSLRCQCTVKDFTSESESKALPVKYL